MAKKNGDLFDTLRASGVRKRVAKTISDTGDRGEDAVKEAVTRLRALADDLETRVTGGSRKRSAAAQKAARTRAANAAKRSAAAKKGARTRAKASR